MTLFVTCDKGYVTQDTEYVTSDMELVVGGDNSPKIWAP